MGEPLKLVIDDLQAVQNFRGSVQNVELAVSDTNSEPLSFHTNSETTPSMGEVDAKIAAAEARTDTKFAQIMGELSTMRAEINGRLDHVEKSTTGIKTTVILTAVAALGLTAAIMSYGGQWFGLGMDTQQVTQRAVESALGSATPKIDALSAKYDQLNQKIDRLILAVDKPSTVPPSPSE